MNNMQSGRPISVAATITGGGTRGNITAGASLKPQDQNLSHWFNTSAFTQPAAYTFGSVSRTLNGINGPAYFNLNGSVFKRFPLTEKIKLQLRGEVFNATNTPSFDIPGRTVGSSTMGYVLSTTSPTRVREMQLALQLLF
jgi:hypothetical protein